MKLIHITHKKSECIGCMLCAEVAPHYWTMDEQGEAQLLNVTHTDTTFQYGQGFEEDRSILEEVGAGCPVNIIHMR